MDFFVEIGLDTIQTITQRNKMHFFKKNSNLTTYFKTNARWKEHNASQILMENNVNL